MTPAPLTNFLAAKLKAGSLATIAVANFAAALFQTVAAPDTHSILGIAAVINAILSFGLLGGALAVAYGYGGLNKEVSLMHERNVERDRKFSEFVEKMEVAGSERSAKLWKELNELREKIAEQRGRESVLRELVDLPQKR